MVIEKKYKIDKEVVLDSANLYLLENGVIHIHIKIDYEVDLEIASEIAKAREILSGDVPRLILYTTEDKLLIPSPEVRDFVASEERSRLIIEIGRAHV